MQNQRLFGGTVARLLTLRACAHQRKHDVPNDKSAFDPGSFGARRVRARRAPGASSVGKEYKSTASLCHVGASWRIKKTGSVSPPRAKRLVLSGRGAALRRFGARDAGTGLNHLGRRGNRVQCARLRSSSARAVHPTACGCRFLISA